MLAQQRIPYQTRHPRNSHPRLTPRKPHERHEQNHRHGKLNRNRPQMPIIRRTHPLIPIPRLRHKHPNLAQTVPQLGPKPALDKRRETPAIMHEPETHIRRRHAGQIEPQPAPKHRRRERRVQICVSVRAG